MGFALLVALWFTTGVVDNGVVSGLESESTLVLILCCCCCCCCCCCGCVMMLVVDGKVGGCWYVCATIGGVWVGAG